MVILDSIRNLHVDGYHFITMSESWQNMCLDLPCSPRVKIPPLYATAWIDIDGLVIQAWKGNCPHVPGFPGGIGGEVGVYRREPSRAIGAPHTIPDLKAFPRWQRPLVKAVARAAIRRGVEIAEGDVDRWWPAPVREPIRMRFSHGRELFAAEQLPVDRPIYWLSRWMTYTSYLRFAAAHRDVPAASRDFEMELSVGDRVFRWGDPGSPIVVVR